VPLFAPELGAVWVTIFRHRLLSYTVLIDDLGQNLDGIEVWGTVIEDHVMVPAFGD
jgi:hypothetical protein